MIRIEGKKVKCFLVENVNTKKHNPFCMVNQPPKLKTFNGVRNLFRKIQELPKKTDGVAKLGITLLFISMSKELEEGYRKSLIEKATSIFDRR